MALHSMPVLYFNLCGEMMYVLEQRLKAQNIPSQKTEKVLTDIIATMFGKKFVAELFQPREVFSRSGFHTLFSKLAHTSIMRLNTTSMDRLFDLMMMAVKQQLLGCLDPTDILFATFNHLDGMRKMVSASPTLDLLTYAHSSFVKYYSPMTYGELTQLRLALLAYYQDVNIKVALFLREGIQTNNGKFALPFTDDLTEPFVKPGVIRNLKTGRATEFSVSSSLKVISRKRGTNIGDARGTKLGLNMYNPANCVFGEKKSITPPEKPGSADEFAFSARSDSTISDSSGKDLNLDSQLGLMLKLLGTSESPNDNANQVVTLDLFNKKKDDEWMKTAETMAATEQAKREKMITLDASKQKRPVELQRLIDDFSKGTAAKSKSKSAGDDLLELFDSSVQ